MIDKSKIEEYALEALKNGNKFETYGRDFNKGGSFLANGTWKKGELKHSSLINFLWLDGTTIENSDIFEGSSYLFINCTFKSKKLILVRRSNFYSCIIQTKIDFIPSKYNSERGHVVFYQSTISNSNLFSKKLPPSNSYVKFCLIENSSIHGIPNVGSSDIRQSQINKTTIENSSTKNCTFENCEVSDSSIEKSKISQSKIRLSQIGNSTLISSLISYSVCTNSKSTGCDFYSVVWRSGTFENSTWRSGIWLDGTWKSGVLVVKIKLENSKPWFERETDIPLKINPNEFIKVLQDKGFNVKIDEEHKIIVQIKLNNKIRSKKRFNYEFHYVICKNIEDKINKIISKL